jgi:hypothetical protein
LPDNSNVAQIRPGGPFAHFIFRFPLLLHRLWISQRDCGISHAGRARLLNAYCKQFTFACFVQSRTALPGIPRDAEQVSVFRFPKKRAFNHCSCSPLISYTPFVEVSVDTSFTICKVRFLRRLVVPCSLLDGCCNRHPFHALSRFVNAPLRQLL